MTSPEVALHIASSEIDMKVRRHGRVQVICENPRHKQRQG
jgi:ribosomal protein L36